MCAANARVRRPEIHTELMREKYCHRRMAKKEMGLLRCCVEENAGKYLHLLVFQCGQCGNPIAIPWRSEGATLGSVGAVRFSICCRCGWSAWLEGVSARNHWVESWQDQKMDVAVAG